MNEPQILKWNRLLHQSTFAWWDWDLSTNRVEFNDLKATMLGYDPLSFDGKGYQGFTDLLHPDDFAKTMAAMQRVLDRRTDLYQIDYRILASDGGYRWYMDRGLVLDRATDGSPSRLRGIVIDLGKEAQRSGNVETLLDILDTTASRLTKLGVSWLTLCSCCKKIKHDDAHWIEMSPELIEIVGDDISHGICPACMQELYPEYAEKVLAKRGIPVPPPPIRTDR